MSVTHPSSLTGSRSSAISNLTIRLVARYTGRGPNKVRTYFNDDMVTIVLRDMLTKAESTLLAKGEADLVLTTRHTFQELMSDELVAGVEEVMQRKVIAFMSANHVDPDMAVETFILAPADDGDAAAPA
jgi:uncharacterized protein YbcI